MESHPKGLSTYDALNCLHDDIEKTLKAFKETRSKRKLKGWIYDALLHTSPYTSLHWISAMFIFLIALILLNFHLFSNSSVNVLRYSAIILFCILSFNLYLVISENKLRHNEMSKRVESLLATLKLAIQNVKWLPENYPHLCTPFSPCVTLQWAYRDGALVNLPWALLVKDDIILIRPGQLSPGLCEALDKNSDCLILRKKEIYGPSLPYANEIFSVPKTKVPLKNKLYILKETPYLNNLRIALEKALNRPVTKYDSAKYFLFNQCLELYSFITVCVLTIFFNIIKLIYCPIDFKFEWADLFLLQPITVGLPLLPIMFPSFWIAFNILGLARFKTFFNNTSKTQLTVESDHFTDPESLTEAEIEFEYQWSEVLNVFLNLLTGKELMMTRTANIIHVFAQLSALCVIDKKGILSWPNPTAEKVFFLRSADDISQSSSIDSMNDSEDDEALNITVHKTNQNKPPKKESAVEVLDLTHNHNIPFKLEFDDHDWKQYMSSLKPIGLAILLNTCNMETQESYTRFCSHITCEAMYNEHLVPVANRRCLCELSKHIGFVDNAQNVFTLEEQISAFRHLPSDIIRKDKLARALHLTTKLKYPFPHMVAVIVKEINSDANQLFSQGTADIILDSCVDYWNGKDLRPLTSSDRKKITDFYSRTSLTSYCTAFAYRPLNRIVDSKLSQIYLELPSNSKQAFMAFRSPTPLHWDIKHTGSDSRIRGIMNHFHSTDSLLYTDNKEDIINDVESCFEMQCNQVFLGMVTMQYQAQSDMIHLIERLERACVRFVHFSKENELRSRVFSEKMGLESGWNCHISLLSDKAHNSECWANNGTARVWSPSLFPQRVINRRANEKANKEEENQLLLFSTNLETSKAMSISAPSAINLDCTVVKFDEDTIVECGAIEDDKLIDDQQETDDQESEKDSVMVQSVDLSSHQDGWPSLSCLTDSTEQSAPVHFDMSNRAKLPKGIENIRPHLESIDNVPLLVSLFTDCTPTVTAEMIHIMQNYGQTVCVLGSAANAENIDVFMQADISIAVEPLYPQMCQRVPVITPINPVFGPPPVGLNRSLNALPCSLTFRREDPVSVFHLILEARHYMFTMWNCVQFWLCCMVSLSFLQLIVILLLLPPLLNVDQVLWLICVIVPILSASFLGSKKCPSLMQKPAQKLQFGFDIETVIFVIWSYGGKFVPLIVFSLLIYFGSLINFCDEFALQNSNITCSFYIYATLDNKVLANDIQQYSFYAEQITIFMMVLLLCILSISFVHRDHLTWKLNPLKNIFWGIASIFIFVIQIIYTVLNIYLINETFDEGDRNMGLSDLSWCTILLIIFAPIITFLIAEFIKWQEIQVNLRYLRRARLDFGTKLGMNSPF